MHSINLYCTDTTAEFQRLVWLLIAHGGYVRDTWRHSHDTGYRDAGGAMRCTVCDVPTNAIDAVLDAWLGV